MRSRMSMTMTRRLICCLALLGLAALAIAQATGQQATPLTLKTAGRGSSFMPYGEGVARFLAAGNITVEVKDSSGSNENLTAVDQSATTLGTAFLGSAYDAVHGLGWAAGHEHRNVRALFPMYETSFQVAALRKSAISSLADLDGKKVGVGPSKGPAEVFFRAAAGIAKIKPVIVTGDPAELARQVLAGEIDALWQGAVVPIPPLSQIADKADAVVFGLSDAEVAAMLQMFPQLSPTTIAGGTYKGQATDIKSVSSWNFVVANKELPDEIAYAITKAIMSATDPKSEIYPSAAGTLAKNAATNRVMPFHPGAARYYAEAGIKLSAP